MVNQYAQMVSNTVYQRQFNLARKTLTYGNWWRKLKKYAKKHGVDTEAVEAVVETLTEEKSEEKDYKPLLIETLDKLDEGEGVELKRLLAESKLPENTFEEVINVLLSDGICFEPKPGVLKMVW